MNVHGHQRTPLFVLFVIKLGVAVLFNLVLVLYIYTCTLFRIFTFSKRKFACIYLGHLIKTFFLKYICSNMQLYAVSIKYAKIFKYDFDLLYCFPFVDVHSYKDTKPSSLYDGTYRIEFDTNTTEIYKYYFIVKGTP